MVKVTLFVLFCCLTMAFVPGGGGNKKPLTLEFTGLKNTKGHLLIAVFDAADGFPENEKKAIASAKVKPIVPGTPVVFDLEPGKPYAAAVLHDEDDNGKMSYGTFLPKESFGFSNNPKIVFGPPGFKQASFLFTGTPGFTHKVILKHP